MDVSSEDYQVIYDANDCEENPCIADHHVRGIDNGLTLRIRKLNIGVFRCFMLP